MTQIQDRRSDQGQIPTAMMQAVSGMSTWKLNVMFVAGLSFMACIVYWFAFPAEGHEHGKVELMGAGGAFAISAFFVFPLGITRLADKFWPARWRTERRK